MNNTNKIFLGKNNSEYMYDDNNNHTLLIAPPHTGKGAGIIIPNSITWQESVVFLDIKGELYNITAGYRKNILGQTIIKYDPSNPEGSAKFNPLDEIKFFTESELKDTINIVRYFFDNENDSTDFYLNNLAERLIISSIIHLKYLHGNICFSDTLKFISDKKNLKNNFLKMITSIHAQTTKQEYLFQHFYHVDDGIHPFVKETGIAFIKKSETEIDHIINRAKTLLKDFADPIIANNTCRSDFHIQDLMYADKCISLYLVLPYSDLDRTSKFFRLIISLITRNLPDINVLQSNKSSCRHDLLLLLDSFLLLGKMTDFEQSLSYIIGYGITVFMSIEELSQLYNIYGDHIIADNCHTKIMFNSNKYDVLFTGKKQNIKCEKISYYKEEKFKLKTFITQPKTDTLYPING